jgi:hypothetical protein
VGRRKFLHRLAHLQQPIVIALRASHPRVAPLDSVDEALVQLVGAEGVGQFPEKIIQSNVKTWIHLRIFRVVSGARSDPFIADSIDFHVKL